MRVAMSDHPHSCFTEPERQRIANAVKQHLAGLGWSRKQLQRKDLSLSTINKALAGDFSDITLAKIEAILQHSFSPGRTDGEHHSEAAKVLGGYARSAVAELEGRYVCVRPAFSNPRLIYAYGLTIFWDTNCSWMVDSQTTNSALSAMVS